MKFRTSEIPNYIIYAFLIVRLALNLQLTPLSIFFALSYIFLLALLSYKSKFFLPILAAFLAIDSMIGTYLFTVSNNLNFEYYATMAINIFIALMAIWNDRAKRLAK